MSTPKLPDQLRGNPFIGVTFKVTNPDDLAFGEPPVPRTCAFCFFRHRAGHRKDPDCMVASKEPKQAFDIPEDTVMPEQMDGVEVGFYCRTWTHYDAE